MLELFYLYWIKSLLSGYRVPGNRAVHDGVDDHDDDQDVEGVEQPVVNHLVVCCLWDHFVDTGLNCSDNHHSSDCDHDAVLKSQ